MIEVYIGDKENWAYVEAGSAWCQVAMGECAIGMWTNKEGKPMSEKKETIEDRRKKVVEDLAYIHDWSGEPDKRRIDGALTLLSDLMAEREKLKGRIEELTETIRERERYISTITSRGTSTNKRKRPDNTTRTC